MAKGRIVYDGESAALAADPDRLAQLIGVAELDVSPRGSPSGRCPRPCCAQVRWRPRRRSAAPSLDPCSSHRSASASSAWIATGLDAAVIVWADGAPADLRKGCDGLLADRQGLEGSRVQDVESPAHV